MSLEIGVQRLAHAEGLDLPAYQTAGAAGLDLLAALPPNTKIVLEPGARDAIPTGLVFAVPDGYEAQVRPRSGLALRFGVTVLNSPGTVDSDYRGEIRVILVNHGRDSYEIVRGARIAQIVFARVERAVFVEAELETTARGIGGFGSTGSGAEPARP